MEALGTVQDALAHSGKPVMYWSLVRNLNHDLQTSQISESSLACVQPK